MQSIFYILILTTLQTVLRFFFPFVSVGFTKFSISLAIQAEAALSFLPSLIFVFSVSGEKWLGPQPHSAVKL